MPDIWRGVSIGLALAKRFDGRTRLCKENDRFPDMRKERVKARLNPGDCCRENVYGNVTSGIRSNVKPDIGLWMRSEGSKKSCLRAPCERAEGSQILKSG